MHILYKNNRVSYTIKTGNARKKNEIFLQKFVVSADTGKQTVPVDLSYAVAMEFTFSVA